MQSQSRAESGNYPSAAPRLQSANGSEIIALIPCTDQQSEILTACVLGGDDANRAFNQSATLQLKGRLSISSLESAINLLVERHDSLRMVFDLATNHFCVLKTLPVELNVRMLTGTGRKVQEVLENQVYSEAMHVFDLQKGPLLRVTVLTDGDIHYLVFTLHHIVFDGWSLGVFLKRLEQLYNSFATGSSTPAPPSPLKYSEYARKENYFSTGPVYTEMKDYWLRKYSDYKPLPVLPYDHPRPDAYTFKSKSISFNLDKKLLADIKELAELHECSLMVTMAAVFEVLLYKVSGNKQFVLGVPTAGQPVSGFEDILGHCVNLLPVDVMVDGSLKFSDYIEKRKKVYWDAFENRRVTLGSLLKSLKMDRRPSAAPFMPVTFNMYRPMMQEVHFEGMEAGLTINPREYSSFDMLVNLIRNEDETELECSYNEALFEYHTVFNFLKQYEDLLGQICLDETSRIEELCLCRDHHTWGREAGVKAKQDDLYSRDKAYWLREFTGDLPVLEMPADRPRSPVRTKASAVSSHLIGKNDTSKLKELLQARGVSMCTGLLSLVNILLYRYTDQEDFIIGHKLMAPGHIDKDRHGHIVALRCRVNGEDSFTGLLDNLDHVLAEAVQHRQYPFEELVAELNLLAEKNRHPLFDVLVTFEDDTLDGSRANRHAGLDLVFAFRNTGESLVLDIHYDTELFDEDTIKRISTHLEGICHMVTVSPSGAINQLDLLSEAERNCLLYKWNDTRVAFDTEVTLLDLFKRQVMRMPDAQAVTDGTTSMNYSELDVRSDALASILLKIVKEEDDYIAVNMERSVEMVVALFAVMKAGKAYVPLEPAVPAERKSVMLNAIQCSVVITDADNLVATEELGHTTLNINGIPEQQSDGHTSMPQIAPTDVAYAIFTSGSTGVPKAVIVRHQSVVNLIEWVNTTFNISEKDQVLCTASISFDLSVYDIFGMLAAGGSIRIATNTELKDPRLLSDIVYNETITFWNSAPAVLHQLVPFFRKLPASGHSSLRLVFLSGDWIPLGLPDEVRAAFPAAKVISLGGATEATVWSNYFPIEKTEPAWKSIPYGRPMQNAQYYILNSALQPVPVGVTGNLYIGGEVLAVGYTDPLLSAKKFMSNPFLPGERIYDTGDKARFYKDGNIEFLGRADDQVKIRGYRIELGDIENALHKYPGVDRVIILVKEDANFQKSLVAYVMSAEMIPVSDLSNYLRLKLPSYFIPDHFVVMKEFPLTCNGKINRKKLPEPEEGYSARPGVGEQAETETAKLVLNIWQQVLGLEKIKMSDNFFQIGGHSLKAIAVLLRIEKAIGCKVPMSALFTHPSIESLSAFLDSNTQPKWKYIVPVKPAGTKPPLYLIHGAGLGVMVFQDIANNMDEEQPVYGIQAMGLNTEESIPETIEEIVSAYMGELLLHNPDGPYILAGFSVGVLIAYEIALQLKNAGKTVAFLGNFDFSTEFFKGDLSDSQKMQAMITQFIPRQLHFLKNAFTHPLKSWVFQKQFAKLRFQGLAARLGIKVGSKTPPELEKIDSIYVRYLAAFSRYKIKPYEGKMDIFNSRIKIYYLRDKHYLGWDKYILQDINVHHVNSDHDHMILPPNSRSFAGTLQGAIDGRLSEAKGNAFLTSAKRREVRAAFVPRMRTLIGSPVFEFAEPNSP